VASVMCSISSVVYLDTHCPITCLFSFLCVLFVLARKLVTECWVQWILCFPFLTSPYQSWKKRKFAYTNIWINKQSIPSLLRRWHLPPIGFFGFCGVAGFWLLFGLPHGFRLCHSTCFFFRVIISSSVWAVMALLSVATLWYACWLVCNLWTTESLGHLFLFVSLACSSMSFCLGLYPSAMALLSSVLMSDFHWLLYELLYWPLL
jgi:hypothetical protein